MKAAVPPCYTQLFHLAGIWGALVASGSPALAADIETPSVFRPAARNIANVDPRSEGYYHTLASDGAGKVYIAWSTDHPDHSVSIAATDSRLETWSAPQNGGWQSTPAIALRAIPPARLVVAGETFSPFSIFPVNAPAPEYHIWINDLVFTAGRVFQNDLLADQTVNRGWPAVDVNPDGERVFVWLEWPLGQQTPRSAGLRVRIGSDLPVMVDPSVSLGWQSSPALAVYPDGTVLVAYRGLAPDNTRDVLLARRVNGSWDKPRRILNENWSKADPLDNLAPRIARNGGRAVVTWYSAPNNEPQIVATTSSDAGASFSQADRIDLGRPTGRPEVAMLHDGSYYVLWLESPGEDASEPGGLYLRRTTAYGTTLPPARLVPAKDLDLRGNISLAVAKDYTDTPAELVVAFNLAGAMAATPGSQPRIKTLRVTLPDLAVLQDADRGCGCAPTSAEQAGVTIRAQVISVSSDRKTVRLRHGAIPGLLDAGERNFLAGPELPADIRSGLEVLAHLDEKDGGWTLLDYRVLVMPQNTR